MAKAAKPSPSTDQRKSDLQARLEIKNTHAVPQLDKIIINVGIGTFLKTSKDYSEITDNVTKLTGQKPIVTYAKKAISNFKLRIGMPVGLKVTLRGKRMIAFFDKLVKIIFPRIRDFRGFSRSAFDPRGNCTIGIKEATVFPEVNPDDVTKIHGLEITFVTTAKTAAHGIALFESYGFPFKKEVVEAAK